MQLKELRDRISNIIVDMAELVGEIGSEIERQEACRDRFIVLRGGKQEVRNTKRNGEPPER